MHPILVDLGFLKLPSYGVALAIAVLVALWTLRRRADAAGLDGPRLVDLCLWLVIWALLGAKLLLVIIDLRRYLSHPGELLGVVRAGGVFLGGFLAAAVVAVILLRRYRLRFLPAADVIVPSLALGHAIGRIGCLMAGCCWGAHCEAPWAITYTDPQAAVNVGTPLHVPLHPFPLYAAVFNFTLFLVLAALYRSRPATGRVFGTYLVLYGVGRFALEFFRGDDARGFLLNGLMSTSQAIAIALVLVGAALHVWLLRRRPKNHDASPGQQVAA
jgi:phosphatidylglycerol:prolipoprotein diacylglycerol transferase